MLKELMLVGSILVSPVCLQASEFNLSTSTSVLESTSEKCIEDVIIPLSVVGGGCLVLATGYCLYKYHSWFSCWRSRPERLSDGSYGSIED